jgi:hypothetical protein
LDFTSVALTISDGEEGEWKESEDAGEHFYDRRLVGNDTRCEDGLFSLFCLAFIHSLPLFMEHFLGEHISFLTFEI